MRRVWGKIEKNRRLKAREDKRGGERRSGEGMNLASGRRAYDYYKSVKKN